MRFPFILIAASSISACTAYRLPPTPTTYWIWEDEAAALDWRARTTQRLCIEPVPDGFATYGCPCTPYRWPSLADARAHEARFPTLRFDVIWDPTDPEVFTTECI